MMLVALMAPELTFGLAARQYIVAHWFARSKHHFCIAYQIDAQATR
jgi:DNA-binding CsgD family transcriptional regulator